MGELKFRLPLDGELTVNRSYKITIHPIKKESKLHAGIDYKATAGTEVKASESGVVIRASHNKTLDNVIIIDHAPLAGENGRHIYTLYAHLNEMIPDLGEYVLKGETIGLSGGEPDETKSKEEQTSTGPHLHFGLFDSEKRLDFKPTGPTTIPGSLSSDPTDYFFRTHSVEGTILDLDDLQDQVRNRVEEVMELVPTLKPENRRLRLDIMVYGKYMGYLDTRNQSLNLNFTFDQALEVLRKPITKRKTEYVVNR